MKNILCTLFIAVLSACTVKPPDVPACEHLSQRLYEDPATGHQMLEPSPTCEAKIGEAECGHCVQIMSGKETFYGEAPAHWLNGHPWSYVRARAVLMPAKESYAPMSAYMINACKEINCSSQVTAFKVRARSLGVVKAVEASPSPSPSPAK